MKKVSFLVFLLAMSFIAGAFVAPTASADEPSDFTALVGKWVWSQPATCGTCRAFTAVLTITSASADGALSGTYQQSEANPGLLRGVAVKPRATMTDGKIKVAFKAGRYDFDLEYVKGTESLRGPVSGFPPRQVIEAATFRREK